MDYGGDPYISSDLEYALARYGINAQNHFPH